MSVPAKNSESELMGTTIVSIIAVLLFGYLLVAMLRPEKF